MSHSADLTVPANSDVVGASEAVLQHHARSFSLAALFLSRSMRQNAAVCYAFCRLVDDAVDEVPDKNEARRRLGLVEDMLEGRLQQTPLVASYAQLMEQSGIGLGPARDLIEGARSDLETVRIVDDEGFLEYCYRVAGTVGLMMCGVLGVRDSAARRHAVDLGIAMQMTNICRDVLEDAGRDRIYLPSTRLQAVGVQAEELLAMKDGGVVSPSARAGVARVVRHVLDWADEYYESGGAGFRFIPTRARLAIVIARALYRDIGRTLRRRSGDALAGRATVSPFRKLLLTVEGTIRWILGALLKPSEPLQPAVLRLPSK